MFRQECHVDLSSEQDVQSAYLCHQGNGIEKSEYLLVTQLGLLPFKNFVWSSPACLITAIGLLWIVIFQQILAYGLEQI